MSFDPGPISPVVFDLPDTKLARLLSRWQESVLRWADRFRLGEGYDDLQAPPIEGLSTSALTNDELIDGSGVIVECFRHDQTDDLSYTKQFSHKWAGGVVNPHIHVVPLAAAAGNIAFNWKYGWLGVNQKLAAMTTGTTIVKAITAEDYTRHLIVPLGDLTPPENLGNTSAFLILFVERDSGTLDTYTTNKGWGTLQANLALLGVDVHHRQRLFGSEGLYK